MNNQSEMSLIVITDSPLFTLALRSILSPEIADLQIHVSDTLQNAIAIAASTQFQSMLLDINVKDGKEISFFEEFKKQNPQTGIIVNLGNEPEYIYSFIRNGANGIIYNKTQPPEVVKAYKASVISGRYVCTDLQQIILSHIVNPSVHTALTKKEYLVARLIAENKNPEDIAAIAGINHNTVSLYKRRIFQKLSVKNLGDLALKLGTSNTKGIYSIT
jgi:DNA-binding NarL/FixJ family response regulator